MSVCGCIAPHLTYFYVPNSSLSLCVADKAFYFSPVMYHKGSYAKNETRKIGDQISELDRQVAEAEAARDHLLLRLPNLPHSSVAIGKTAASASPSNNTYLPGDELAAEGPLRPRAAIC